VTVAGAGVAVKATKICFGSCSRIILAILSSSSIAIVPLHPSVSGSSDLRNGTTNGHSHSDLPASDAASSIKNATRRFFSSGFFSICSSTQANFCWVVTMIGFRLVQKSGEIVGLARQAHKHP